MNEINLKFHNINLNNNKKDEGIDNFNNNFNSYLVDINKSFQKLDLNNNNKNTNNKKNLNEIWQNKLIQLFGIEEIEDNNNILSFENITDFNIQKNIYIHNLNNKNVDKNNFECNYLDMSLIDKKINENNDIKNKENISNEHK